MLTLHINGRDVQVDADPATPILWMLRDHLDMTGTKFGCGAALCGACTVQAAWVKHDVPQCGYCQSGQVMSATALLRANNKPTDTDIDNAMSGNICRCGTYQRIRAAVKDAAAALA